MYVEAENRLSKRNKNELCSLGCEKEIKKRNFIIYYFIFLCGKSIHQTKITISLCFVLAESL
jgi:hypothetical protein